MHHSAPCMLVFMCIIVSLRVARQGLADLSPRAAQPWAEGNWVGGPGPGSVPPSFGGQLYKLKRAGRRVFEPQLAPPCGRTFPDSRGSRAGRVGGAADRRPRGWASAPWRGLATSLSLFLASHHAVLEAGAAARLADRAAVARSRTFVPGTRASGVRSVARPERAGWSKLEPLPERASLLLARLA